jgi:hypothetical protein
MRGSMSWNDTLRAAALAAQAERTANATRIAVNAPWRRNPHFVWVSRVRLSRDRPTVGPQAARATRAALLNAFDVQVI